MSNIQRFDDISYCMRLAILPHTQARKHPLDDRLVIEPCRVEEMHCCLHLHGASLIGTGVFVTGWMASRLLVTELVFYPLSKV